MQLGLLDYVPLTRAAAKPRTAPTLPVLDETLEYDNGPGCSVAGYSATLRNHHFGEWCRAGVWVSLERHFGWKPHRWMASVHIELPDELRTSWHTHAIFPTQEEAAREAADMGMVGRRLLDAFLRGESVETPGQRRGRAAEEHAAADSRYIEAMRLVAAERAALDALGEDVIERVEQHRRRVAASQAAERLRVEIMDEFCLAHGWREFAAGLLEGA